MRFTERLSEIEVKAGVAIEQGGISRHSRLWLSSVCGLAISEYVLSSCRR